VPLLLYPLRRRQHETAISITHINCPCAMASQYLEDSLRAQLQGYLLPHRMGRESRDSVAAGGVGSEANPSSTLFSFTLPAIYDRRIHVAVMDSIKTARYLGETYSDTPIDLVYVSNIFILSLWYYPRAGLRSAGVVPTCSIPQPPPD